LAKRCIAATGYEDISLLSLSTGDYTSIAGFLKAIMDLCGPEKIAVSFPSLRAGTLTPQLMEMIKKVRKTGFTIAPEAGSQRLRDIINKNINHDQIINTVQDALALGWQVIKLYFMVGLPGENQQDIEEIITLVKELRSFKTADGKKIKLNASFTTFIPKSHTPFQWEGQASLKYSKETIGWIKKELHIPGVQVKWQQPEVSQIEGLFARGDRRLSHLLESAYKNGCKFDGWTESFKYEKWLECAGNIGIDIQFETQRNRSFEEPLPWNHIDSKITKEFLWKERIKAFQGKTTQDCRQGDCNKCGVCDFNEVKPFVHKEFKQLLPVDRDNDKKEVREKRIALTYEKIGSARFFGHLEMVNIWLRAIKRAKIPIQYSKGFHPMPKVSFENPLPLGIESYEERMYMNVDETVCVDQMHDELKEQLPVGINLISCRIIHEKKLDFSDRPVIYDIELRDKIFEKAVLDRFNCATDVPYIKKNKKGKKIAVNLKAMVLNIVIQNNNRLKMTLTAKSIKAAEIIKTIFDLNDSDIQTARIVKLSPDNINP
jgi:radical SAM-linked protein